MNKEMLSTLVEESNIKHPGIEVLPPGSLTPESTATEMITLLEKVYVKHGITKHKKNVINDLKEGTLQTWLAKKDDQFVATASLVTQPNSDVELGRAVSLEKGNGKLLMLLGALHHLENNADAPLVAEVRVAEEFGEIPSGEATQHICFELFDLVPHAIAPFFAHGDPLRRESFILARNDTQLGKTVSELAFAPLNNRNMHGKPPGLKLIQTEPFRIAIPDENGNKLEKLFTSNELERQEGFTLFPVETTDANMSLIGALFGNPRIILCGVDSHHGKNDKPIVLFGTIGRDTVIAPTKITSSLPQPIRRDLQNIADQFDGLSWHALPRNKETR